MLEEQKRKVLSINESSLHCLTDLYHPLTNPDGFVTFGFAKNGTVINQTLTYLPKYITSTDCNYQSLKGSLFINKFAISDTCYNLDETIVINSLLAVIDTLASNRKISFQGELQYFLEVIDHAKAQVVLYEDSECNFAIYPQSEAIKKLILGTNQKMTVIVVKQKSDIIYSQNQNIYYAYQIAFNYGYKFGVCHSKNSQALTKLENVYCFHPLSTVISSTIEALETNYETNAPLQKQFMNKTQKHKDLLQAFHLMISLDSGYNPRENHLFFCLGATGCLNNWAYSLFKKGDLVGIDAPFYFFMSYDFLKSGLSLSFRYMSSNTLMERIKKSQAKGQKGYIIVNPHNPTGKVFSPQQIDLICKWAIDHPHYHVLINEMYFNSVYSKQTQIKSAISYADNHQNITVIRGFAKDYGICGFKVGFMISCNPIIIANFNKWKALITPQRYVLKTISRILEESNYGQNIYKVSRIGLNASTDLACEILQQYNISFTRPQGAVFIIIDLSKYLEQHPEQTEQSLWCKLFYDHKVNVSRGLLFNMNKPGFYRISHISQEENIRQGLKRIGNCVMGIPTFIKSQQ